MKKVEGRVVYRVNNTQLSKIDAISSLEIPQRSKELLSKLVINHKLEGIKSVKKRSNTILLHVKISKNFRKYHDLNSDFVMMKIFMGKITKSQTLKLPIILNFMYKV